MTMLEVDWKYIKSLLPQELTPSQVMYQLFTRDKYHNDPEFRKQHKEQCLKYYKEKVAGTEKPREAAKAYYYKHREEILAKYKEKRQQLKNNL